MRVYVVVSDPAGPDEDFDRWDEAEFDTRAAAEAYREEMLDRIAADGLDRAEWEDTVWVEERSAPASS